MQAGGVDPPTHEAVVQDLRRLRERGLMRVRQLALPALDAAAALADSSGPPGIDAAGPAAARTSTDTVASVEHLLRQAVDRLGDEEPGLAAQYLFGLVRGTIGRRPTDLREKAAGLYGLSPETFRKEPERLLISRIADEILAICRARPDREDREDREDQNPPSHGPVPADLPGPPGPPGPPDPADPNDPDQGLSATTRQRLREALQHVLADDDGLPSEDHHHSARYGPFAIAYREGTVRVTVHLGQIQELHDVDIVVSSENTYLEPAHLFSATLSGQLRSSAAVRDQAGHIVRDVVADELAQWVREHGRPGGQVEPGSVVPTSSGALGAQGIRRIYHAAALSPRPGTRHYETSASAVIRAVHSCFALARQERDAWTPPLTSITMPLFGAGRAGVDGATTFSRLWPAVVRETTADPRWSVHLTTLHPAETATVLRGLYRSTEGRY